MKAIVLHRQDWREFDQIISFYTFENGKINLLARGIKKIVSKNSGFLFVGGIVEIEMAKGKEIDHLTKVNPIWIWKNIRQSLDKQFITAYILKITNKLTKTDEKDISLFILLQDFLEYIDINDNLISLPYCYIIKLTALLGFQPKLSACSNCNQVMDLQWLDIKSGLICTKCYGTMKHSYIYRINSKQIYIWQSFLNLKMEDAIKIMPDKKLIELIYKFTEYHLEIKIN